MVYVDTNILIYLLEDTGSASVMTADLFEHFKQQEHDFITSTLTITEFLAGTTDASFETLQTIPLLSFWPIDESIAVRAAALQQTTSLRIGDVLHLATAVQKQCDVLFTNDKPFASVASKHIKIQMIGAL